MSKTYNRVTLVGRLGKDPEVKVFGPESMTTELRLATNHWDGKAKAEVATWHTVKVVGKRAEKVGEWCRKGDLVLVEGELREDQWTDKATGQERRKTYVLAFDAQNLSGKAQAGGTADTAEDMPW